jgi:hypothetical protein
MNTCKFAALLGICIFTSYANAGQQQQQDQSPIGIFVSAQESGAIQAIRWRLADSCSKNADCAAHIAAGDNDRRILPSQALHGELPSTPERRRALGLIMDPANQR